MRMNQSGSSMIIAKLGESVGRLSAEQLNKLNNCPKLASLHSIYEALGSLLESDHSYLAQIAELIGRDPPLTSRLLKLVNSVFYGSEQPCTNIEEATLAAGLDQISELILSTPVIEDLQNLQGEDSPVDWTEFWRHSIATAILTREVYSLCKPDSQGDSDYIAGLIHNIGKIILALVFPDEFRQIANGRATTTQEELEQEVKLAGADHAALGAYYLHAHKLPAEIIESTLFHNQPRHAVLRPRLTAAVQVAASLAHAAGVPGIEKPSPPSWQDIESLEGWHALFGEDPPPPYVRTSLEPTMDSLQFFLASMV